MLSFNAVTTLSIAVFSSYGIKQLIVFLIFKCISQRKDRQYILFFLYLCTLIVFLNRMETPKTVLLGKTLNEIQHITQNLGMPKFAAKQIVSWLYEKKVVSIDEMTNLSLKHREML